MNAESLRRAEGNTSRKTASATSVVKRGTSKETARKEGLGQGHDLVPRASLEADQRVRDQRTARRGLERDQNHPGRKAQSQGAQDLLLPKRRRVRKGKTEGKTKINISY